MKRLSSFVVAVLLSCQLSFAAAYESFNTAANEVHQALSHEHAIDHHHHDAFVTHLDLSNIDSAHQHSTDSFQSSALLASIDLVTTPDTAVSKTVFNPHKLTTVFLDGLLRPPRASA